MTHLNFDYTNAYETSVIINQINLINIPHALQRKTSTVSNVRYHSMSGCQGDGSDGDEPGESTRLLMESAHQDSNNPIRGDIYSNAVAAERQENGDVTAVNIGQFHFG